MAALCFARALLLIPPPLPRNVLGILLQSLSAYEAPKAALLTGENFRFLPCTLMHSVPGHHLCSSFSPVLSPTQRASQLQFCGLLRIHSLQLLPVPGHPDPLPAVPGAAWPPTATEGKFSDSCDWERRQPAAKTQSLTSARIVLHQELIQGHPSSSNADHDRAPQDADQPQLLGIAELRSQKPELRQGHEGSTAPPRRGLHQGKAGPRLPLRYWKFCGPKCCYWSIECFHHFPRYAVMDQMPCWHQFIVFLLLGIKIMQLSKSFSFKTKDRIF